ncbi:MAG: GNAT family N-acetyltransferase [Sphingobium sp.]
MNKIIIRRAELGDTELVAPLFDLYRQFYEKPADPALAAHYIGDRLRNAESVIFLAETQSGMPVGFCQIYFGFCSVNAGRICILNDLYVTAATRGSGAGRALLTAAEDFAKQSGALRISLQTARTNSAAQALYESSDWVRNEMFHSYVKPFPA